MASVTLQLDAATRAQMKASYADYLLDPVPHSEFRAQVDGVTITAYASGKVLFQGKDVEAQVARWQGQATSAPSTKASATSAKAKPANHSNLPEDFANWTIIGSDEVGNGSYFGALTVCAVYLDAGDRAKIEGLGVKDSKLLTDAQILDLAPKLRQVLTHELTICSPAKYNEANKTRNANAIKVSLHNFTIQKLLAKLSARQKLALQGVLIDEFTSPQNYFNYLKKEAHPLTKGLYFAEKGESTHLAVACASIIARAWFLESLTTFGAPYDVVLPSGAGANVDAFAAKLIKKYGPDVLRETAKLHFKNTEKALALARKLK
ncbi:ribonuclease HIII [Abiotrophia sp. HMSC24B09]|uniref:ribonuclease HIII n=1 Tax=Abiotrophia sp. HMSC24B09 TaxID=1581061 RepID=UPI0025BD8BB7|nr:ribonuclease HIII [Abiotrophia sp. HMSC24B09]